MQPEHHQEDKGPIQEIWEHFDYKYMQPIFLKELIPQRDLLELKAATNPYEEEEEEEGKK